VPGVEVALAPDGEIRVRGPIVMRGYWGKPRETAEVLDTGGWFSTGDIGTLDADGFLFITDRKKELLVNAYGKNVAPAPVEAGLAASPYVASAFAIGDGRPYLSALLVPRFERLETWAREHAIPFGSREELVSAAPVRELFHGEIDRWNAEQPSERQVKRFTLLPRELTLEAGELTPTLKIKRRVVSEEFAADIEAMYAAEPG
jgi:long-chain acyl-CoA synthetase